jgi:hypothetical protein
LSKKLTSNNNLSTINNLLTQLNNIEENETEKNKLRKKLTNLKETIASITNVNTSDEKKLQAIREKVNNIHSDNFTNVNIINSLLEELKNIKPKNDNESSKTLKNNLIESLTKMRNQITKPSEVVEEEEEENEEEEKPPNLNSILTKLLTNTNKTQKLNKIKEALEYLNNLNSLNENKKGKINQLVGVIQDMGLMHENGNDVIVPPNSNKNKNLIQEIKTKINSLKSKLVPEQKGGKKPTTKKPVKKAPVKKPTTKKPVKKPVKKPTKKVTKK